MTITPLGGLVPTKVSDGVSTPSTPKTPAQGSNASSYTPSSADVLDISSIFGTEAAQPAALKATADSLSQSFGAVQVAGQSLQKQTDIVAQLQQLAAQASQGSLSSTGRQELNIQFQQLVDQLNQIAGTSQFTGKNLLDGTFSQTISQSLGTQAGSQLSSTGTQTLRLPDLSAGGLFGGTQPDLTSQANAQQAAQVLASAAHTLASTQQNVGRFTQSLNYVAAGFESALYNQNAATSTLSGSDLQGDAETGLLSSLMQNAESAMSANGSIPASILGLLE